LNLIWNQDQEITSRSPGIRVCLARDHEAVTNFAFSPAAVSAGPPL
jgi:hypothetical protein